MFISHNCICYGCVKGLLRVCSFVCEVDLIYGESGVWQECSHLLELGNDLMVCVGAVWEKKTEMDNADRDLR